ncbi:hypothetical protein FA13DRAFT_592651 [Coprinellus micaceus]|uniref:Uncharacterized protein n=1 Tax=Coprinellus micaceus TaxID=71717 RepID=A0A4Y7SAC1_COPMI|nr:hypothetical protein FA13DRAFT_592651 [Coprinellus micaceus]
MQQALGSCFKPTSSQRPNAMSSEEASPLLTKGSYRLPGVPSEIHTVHILGFVGCNISLILYGTVMHL